MIYPCNRKLLRNKKKQTTGTCSDIGESQNIYTEWKKPDMKKHILYDVIYLKFLKKMQITLRWQKVS